MNEKAMNSFYYRIPYIEDNRCFYCNQPIKAMKRAEFYGYSSGLGKQIVSCEFEYCRFDVNNFKITVMKTEKEILEQFKKD